MENPDDLTQLIKENQRILSDPRLVDVLTKNQNFWRRFVFKTLPQGHGSGLDADTVDGMHASDFLQRIAMSNRVGVAVGGSGSGATKFTELTDVPASYTGQSGKVAKVKATEDGLEFGTGGGGVTDHGDLTGLSDDDHTQYLNTTRHDTTTRHTLGSVVPHDALASLSEKSYNNLTDKPDLTAYLPVAGGTMIYPGTINSRSLIPVSDASFDLGSASKRFNYLYATLAYISYFYPTDVNSSIGASGYKFKDIWLSGNVNVDGNVDGVDVSTHASNADAHHASGNIKDYTLGLKTGIKAGTNITITDVGGYANIAASGGGAFAGSNAFLGFLNDDREIPTTEKTMISASLVLPSAATVDILVSCIAYTEDSSPSTPQVRLCIDGSVVIYFWMEWFPNPDHVYKGFVVMPWIVALSAGTHTIELRTYAGVVQNTWMESQILKITVVDRSTAMGSCTYTYAGS